MPGIGSAASFRVKPGVLGRFSRSIRRPGIGVYSGSSRAVSVRKEIDAVSGIVDP